MTAAAIPAPVPRAITRSPLTRFSLMLVACLCAAEVGGSQQPPTVPDTTARADSLAGDSTARAQGNGGAATKAAPAASKAGAPASKGSAASRTGAPATKAAAPARPKPVWPVKGPDPRPGSILPDKRIVAYYGNPLSKRMGILGEVPPDEMLRRLNREVTAWSRADTATPVVPALHLIAVVAQGSAGRDGMYRARMADTLIQRVYGWAQQAGAIMFLDIQVGKSTLQAELPRLESWLARPDVHLAIDPEFSMKRGGLPGKRIGTYDAADINYAIDFLAQIVDKYRLPPKVFVVHRFTRPMVTNANRIKLDPRVQIVMHMDGWGAPHLKRDSYEAYVYAEPVQFTGFKLFYKNDTKRGHPLMKPADVLALFPKPLYIQYQ
ncbi:MAG TPA: hypothetical protein VLE53_15450 [Gemmatimonadaceae bacterium]|nr:hypothetical protein [Gemmatimonadaceae bacterium]